MNCKKSHRANKANVPKESTRRPHNTDNISTADKDLKILNNMKPHSENDETRDSERRSQSIQGTVRFDENVLYNSIGLSVNETDTSKDYFENEEKVSKRHKIGVINKNGGNGAKENGGSTRITDAFGNFDENLVSCTSGLHSNSLNYQIHNEKNNQENKRTNCSFSNKNIESLNYNTKIPKLIHRNPKIKHHGAENNFAEATVKREIDTVDDVCVFPVAESRNEINMVKSGSEINSIPESDKRHSKFFKDVNSKYDYKKTEDEAKAYHSKNITSSQKDINDKFKNCAFNVIRTESEKKRARRVKDIATKPVEPLINYFENLNPKEQPKIKPKIELSKPKQDSRKEHIRKVDAITKPKAALSSSERKCLNASPKFIDKEGPFVNREDILSDYSAGDSKTPIGKVAEDSLSIGSSNGKKQTTQASSYDDLADTNTGVRKRSFKQISRATLSDIRASKGQNILSPTSSLEKCAYCKRNMWGKCMHLKQNLNHSGENRKAIKEHVFIFSDDAVNEMKHPEEQNFRHLRSRHTTRKQKRPLDVLDRSQYDEEINAKRVSFKTKVDGNISSGDESQTSLRNCSIDDNVNKSSLTQNTIKAQKSANSYFSEKRETMSPKRSIWKWLIGLLLTGVIIAMIYEGVSQEFFS